MKDALETKRHVRDRDRPQYRHLVGLQAKVKSTPSTSLSLATISSFHNVCPIDFPKAPLVPPSK